MTAAGRGARLAAMSEMLRQPPGPEQTRHYVIDGHETDVARLAPGLHIVATPIGNLGDITLRALAALAGADLIACEDTRVTRKLLDRYVIATPLTPYHDHNAAQARPALLRRLADGAAIALVSDARAPRTKPATRSRRCPAPRRCWRRSPSPACPPTSFCLPAFCRPKPPRAAAALPSLAAFRRPWCCSRPGRGWPRRWPILRPASDLEKQPSAAS